MPRSFIEPMQPSIKNTRHVFSTENQASNKLKEVHDRKNVSSISFSDATRRQADESEWQRGYGHANKKAN